MLNVQALKGKIVENGLSQDDVAKMIGLSSSTFNRRINDKVFGSDEIEKMANVLKISNDDILHIFFDRK